MTPSTAVGRSDNTITGVRPKGSHINDVSSREHLVYRELSKTTRRKSGLVVSKLDPQLEGRGLESHPLIDGNGIKTMPGSIPAPNPGSFNN